jgi:hypothetical protein
MKACTRGALLAVCAMSVACGGYAHRQHVDHIVAVNWTMDGRPVRLLQDVTAKWSFVGVSPHTVDPTYDLGGMSIAVGTDRPVPLEGFDGWWRVDAAEARRDDRAFIVLVRGSGEPAETRCVVLAVGRPQARCSPSQLNSVSQHGSSMPGDPCDMSYSTPASDATSRVAACRINGRAGLWLIEGQSPVRLLLATELPRLFYPRPGATRAAEVIDEIEDRIRPLEQQFALAWSPDGRRVYYCPDPGAQAVVVDVESSNSRNAEACVIGAVWSDDSVRVAGVDSDGVLRIVKAGP